MIKIVRSSSAISTVKRPGEISFSKLIHFDSFEGTPLMYIDDGSDAGKTIQVSTTVAEKSCFIGNLAVDSKCLELITNAGAGDLCQASYRCHLRDGKRIRIVGKFRFTSDANTNKIYIRLQFYDGTNLHTATIYYVHDGGGGGKLQYIDSAGNPQDITNGAILLNVDSWHELEIEVDFDSDEYISVRCDHLRIDMSGTSSYSAANATDSHFKDSVAVTAKNAVATTCYWDNIIIEEIV